MKEEVKQLLDELKKKLEEINQEIEKLESDVVFLNAVPLQIALTELNSFKNNLTVKINPDDDSMSSLSDSVDKPRVPDYEIPLKKSYDRMSSFGSSSEDGVDVKPSLPKRKESKNNF